MRKTDLLGRRVSVISLGSSYFGGVCPEEKAWDILDAYADQGGNNLDTARVYGKMDEAISGESEKVIGRWLVRRHDAEHFFVGSKGGHPPIRTMDIPRLDRESLTYDARQSLECLSRVPDIYWLHRDDRTRSVGEIIDTMNALMEEGCFKAFGASNWDPDRIEEANAYARAHKMSGFVGTQVQFSLAAAQVLPDPTCRSMTKEAFLSAQREGMFCFAWSSQAKALFTVLAEKGEVGLSPKARERFLTEENRAIFARLTRLSEVKGVPISAITLAFLTCQSILVFPIVGASRPEQLKDLSVAGDTVLTEEEVLFLRDVTK